MVALNLLLIAFLSYVMGSIPTSIWIAKIVYGMDIRAHGSGNAGATNVFRILGWKPALAVVVVDVAKGFVPAYYLFQIRFAEISWDPVYLQLLAGFAAIVGHVYTIFAGFRGGKGVATAAGMLLALYPLATPICILVFAVVVGMTRIVSLASITAAASLPVVLLVLVYGFDRQVPMPLVVLSFAVAAFIAFTHRSNIQRLVRGEEHRFGQKKEPQ